MAAGLPDLVNCMHLAEEGAVLERVYEFGELNRVRNLLADPRGQVVARFVFAKRSADRPGASVTVQAAPILVCQRCLSNFEWSLRGACEIDFAADDEAADSGREAFGMTDGRVSLRELAEEELLLALPIAPACSTPSTCGRAPGYSTVALMPDAPEESRRPFGSLAELLKKT